MFRQELSKITAHMKQYNPFFMEGYSTVWQDPETGHVWAETEKGRMSIFPEDRLGDYFYLRTLAQGRLAIDQQQYPVIGCNLTGIVATGSIRMVAVVRDANADLLIVRLVNALSLYDVTTLQVSAFNPYSELVLASEMALADESDIATALQRLGNEAIVSVDFNLSAGIGFKKLDCLPEICTTC
jgi:hypothetical protein